jgi:serine/threonine protein kinase
MTDVASRLSSALADRYVIERELGQGGMATVYLAQDLKHRRKVALKVLKPELSAVLGGERFLREIAVTATLQHPHILQLYDSGEADSHLYYVMPFIEGQSLRERLQREKQLPIDDTVTIAKTVASALEFAHRRGIVHRDIKPENILLQDNVAVVADFGIAVAVRSAGGERLTETGLSIGTPAYMSPEQVAGERDLDARSDIYSLACVTYEMLAGDPPFTASNAQAVMAKHVKDPAPPITTPRPSVGAALAKALAKALSKVPVDRYESAGAFAAALTAGDPAEDDAAKSVVVLPFVNQSPDPDNEYFADGLTEEIIGDLSRLQGLRVISRNSAMTLKGTKKDTPTIARELRVSHVVTGSVRRAGNALRVTAELVEAVTDTPVWSDKFSGTMEDVFGIQEEIARKIVAALEVKLSDSERRQVADRPIENAVAYDCYLRARQEMYVWTADALHRALQLVDDALAIVGDTPLLLATKAQVYWNEVNTAQVPRAVGLPRASELVDRALALDPDFPLTIFVRGLVAGTWGQPEQALPDLYRAHALWPGDANVLVELCRFSSTAGLRNHGSFVERIVRIDPLTPVTQSVVSTWHNVNGRHREVAPAARRAVSMAPTPSMLHILCAWEIAEAGFHEEACAILARVRTAMDGTAAGSWASFLMHALQRNAEAALVQVTPELEQVLAGNEIGARTAAHGYVLLGRLDDALRWLRTAVGGGFIHYPCLTEHDAFLGPLRADPRFGQLMDEVRPRWEAVIAWERRQ